MDRYGLATALGGARLASWTWLRPTIRSPTPANLWSQRRFSASRPAMGGASRSRRSAAEQAISAPSAFLVTDIISDNDRPRADFRRQQPAQAQPPSRRQDRHDDRFSRQLDRRLHQIPAAGVWAGNNDGHPMRNADGITGAGPIWNQFMEAVLADPAMLRHWEPPYGFRLEASRPLPVCRRCSAPARPRSTAAKTANISPSAGWIRWRRPVPTPTASSPASWRRLSRTGNGQIVQPAVCVMRLTTPDDLQARRGLVLPRGMGGLAMQWRPAAVAGAEYGRQFGQRADGTKLASVGSAACPGAKQTATQTTTETAMGQLEGRSS